MSRVYKFPVFIFLYICTELIYIHVYTRVHINFKPYAMAMACTVLYDVLKRQFSGTPITVYFNYVSSFRIPLYITFINRIHTKKS